jgi:hypothetical protein
MEAALAEFELQQELQRFATQFADRITQATDVLERSPRRAVRDDALRKSLRYVSAAMEIATGQFSEINLLDMIVFVRLCRTALEKYWVPELYREEGGELAEVFTRSELELSQVAARALSLEQRQQLAGIIDAWLVENPTQVRVEGIRLADFAAMAGSASERANQASGLLVSVKSAARAANQALALSERGLFLFQRLPFLWRLQARLAARELIGDTVTELARGPEAPLPRLLGQARHVALRGVVYLGLLGGCGLIFWWVVWRIRTR